MASSPPSPPASPLQAPPPPGGGTTTITTNATTTTNTANTANTATTSRTGPCSLGSLCTAKNQELSDQYQCRHCNKQLHGFISGCSQAKNPKDFRDGVICKGQPCYTEQKPSVGRPDGAANAAASGLPEFLWETQQPKRKRDPNAPKLKRQRYTKQHKQTVLSTLHDSGSKLPEIAKQFQIPEGTLRGWYDEERRQKHTGGEGSSSSMPLPLPLPLALGDHQHQQHQHQHDPMDDDEDEYLPEPTRLEHMEPHNAPHTIQHLPPPSNTDHSSTAIVPPALAQALALLPPVIDETPKKKTRQRYSNETKIQVILALETRSNVSLNDVAKEFNVAAGTVRGWREEADKIQKQAMENRRVGAKANPSRDPLRRVWDAILSLFEKNSRLPLAQRLEVNVAVVRTIGKQARDTLLEAHADGTCPILNPTEYAQMEKFKASETWARKWARDHQVISTKPESPITQAELAHARVAELQHIVAQYPTDRVYTMTATALFFRILPHRTYVSKLPSNERVRACKGLKSKDRMTLYLCANESGTDKLPITCIGKYDHPACFRVGAQKVLPYLSQKQALSDAGTFQMWWRTVFLPHLRTTQASRVLLLVESLGPCKADLLKDPTDQVRVESLPPSTSSTMMYASQHPRAGSGEKGEKEIVDKQTNQSSQGLNAPSLPQCQALEYGILETIKRRYRYRLLQEIMDSFDERANRRHVADRANVPVPSMGLREGGLAHIADSMRLLDSIWNEVAQTTIAKAWQRTKLRPKPKEGEGLVGAANMVNTTTTLALPSGQRAKSEKRQTTREKKQLIKDLNTFLTRHESRDFSKETGSNQLEEMVEKLKNCFLYTDGEVIEIKEMVESLEEWIGLEDSQGMISLFMEEIKQEMNIEYLVKLKEPIEGVVPEAEEPEDAQLEPTSSNSTSTSKQDQEKQQQQQQHDELKLETAMELATTIKATACKLFEHGNILGELAVRLDEASDSVFRLLRKQKAAAKAKEQAEKSKTQKKNALAAAAAAEDTTAMTTTVVPLPSGEEGDDAAAVAAEGVLPKGDQEEAVVPPPVADDAVVPPPDQHDANVPPPAEEEEEVVPATDDVVGVPPTEDIPNLEALGDGTTMEIINVTNV